MYLGIDLGTSSVKVVLLDETQQLLAQATADLRISQPQPLWSEQDPADWWQACKSAIHQLQQTHQSQLGIVRN